MVAAAAGRRWAGIGRAAFVGARETVLEHHWVRPGVGTALDGSVGGAKAIRGHACRGAGQLRQCGCPQHDRPLRVGARWGSCRTRDYNHT
jgi:hypothetical protein